MVCDFGDMMDQDCLALITKVYMELTFCKSQSIHALIKYSKLKRSFN